MTAAAVVYLVTNRVNGHRYIGITKFTAEKRWGQHVYSARRRDASSWLHKAIVKYGAESFDVVQVASCLHADTAAEVEMEIIRSFAPEYNQTGGGEFTAKRFTKPRDSVERAAAKNRGQKRSGETKARQSALKKRLYENPAIRDAATARIKQARSLVDEAKRIEASRKSTAERVWTAESKAKLSASCMGRRYGQDVIDRMRESKKKAVECTTLHTTFDSVSEAAEATGVDLAGISRVCRGQCERAGGLHFTFIKGACHGEHTSDSK